MACTCLIRFISKSIDLQKKKLLTVFILSFSVLTIGGNSNGTACVFPFIYHEKIYTKCTADRHTLLWCATTKNYAVDGKWGNCVPNNKFSSEKNKDNLWMFVLIACVHSPHATSEGAK